MDDPEKIPLPPFERLELPDDPADRARRAERLVAWLDRIEREPVPDDEPDWDVAELFPPGRVR